MPLPRPVSDDELLSKIGETPAYGCRGPFWTMNCYQSVTSFACERIAIMEPYYICRFSNSSVVAPTDSELLCSRIFFLDCSVVASTDSGAVKWGNLTGPFN